jgi:hypothetical protein
MRKYSKTESDIPFMGEGFTEIESAERKAISLTSIGTRLTGVSWRSMDAGDRT